MPSAESEKSGAGGASWLPRRVWRPTLFVRGAMASEDGVTVHDVWSDEHWGLASGGVGAPPPSEDPTLCLFDGDGRLLAWSAVEWDIVRVYSMPPEPGEPLGPVHHDTILTQEFLVHVPLLDGGVSVTLTCAGRTLWSRSAPATRPRVSTPTVKIDGDRLRVRWDDAVAHGADYRARVELLAADGRWWVDLWDSRKASDASDAEATGASRGDCELDLWEAPVGEARVRVSVFDGFHSVSSDDVALSIPYRAPRVTLTEVGPAFLEQMGKLAVSADVRTSGRFATDPTCEYEWLVNGAPAGTGPHLFFEPPEAGMYDVALRLRWRGRETTHTLRLTVTDELMRRLRDDAALLPEVLQQLQALMPNRVRPSRS